MAVTTVAFIFDQLLQRAARSGRRREPRVEMRTHFSVAFNGTRFNIAQRAPWLLAPSLLCSNPLHGCMKASNLGYESGTSRAAGERSEC